MTVLEVLTAATNYLKHHGVEHPRLNAEHLLAHVLGRNGSTYISSSTVYCRKQKRAPFRRLIRDRGTGKPCSTFSGRLNSLADPFSAIGGHLSAA